MDVKNITRNRSKASPFMMQFAAETREVTAPGTAGQVSG